MVDGTVTAKDMFYKAVLQRGRGWLSNQNDMICCYLFLLTNALSIFFCYAAKMIALIAIGMDFPSVAPIFRIQLDMDGESRSSSTDSSVRVSSRSVHL